MEGKSSDIAGAIALVIDRIVTRAALHDEIIPTLNNWLMDTKGIQIRWFHEDICAVVDMHPKEGQGNRIFNSASYTACLEFALKYERKSE